MRTYPTAERLGLVWVFVGAGQAEVPPVEQDIPEELLAPGVTLGGRIQSGRRGNWRYAAENGFDEGHAKFLHRDALWVLFRQMPVWTEARIVRTDDGRWLSRRWDGVYWDADFPGVGRWPPPRSWRRLVQRRPKPGQRPKVHPRIAALRLPGMVSVRVPYILRVAYSSYIHYEWAIPEDAQHHRYVQLMASFRPGRLGAALVPPAVSRLDPLGLPRAVHRPGRVDGRRHGHPARAALPAGRLGHRVAPAGRGAAPRVHAERGADLTARRRVDRAADAG